MTPADAPLVPAPWALEARGLHRRFGGWPWRRGHVALADVSLQLAPGTCWALAGPNGAGKSTLLRCLTGLLRPDAGSVRLLGASPEHVPVRRRLGYLPEPFAFHPQLTVAETLRACAALSGLRGAELEARTQATLEQLELLASADRRVGTLSRGTMQRLGLAQSLVHRPDLVIWDEPTGGLDPVGRRIVADVLCRLRAAGTTVLLATHILRDIDASCSHVAILEGGALRVAGEIAALLQERGLADVEALYFAVAQGGRAHA